MTPNEHPFAAMIRQIGKGKKGRRDLSERQAYQAMSNILAGNVTDIQIGAFLMLMRVKEECNDELVGFVRAIEDFYRPAQSDSSDVIDIAWASYSGKRDESAWYILAQLALSTRYRILCHGGPGHTPGRVYSETIYRELGLFNSREVALNGPSYLALRDWAPRLEELMALRFQLGLRSPLNSVLRLCSPVPARCQVMSVFHPRYAPLHQAAAVRLNRHHSVVFKGAGGEAEVRVNANTLLYTSCGVKTTETTMTRSYGAKLAPANPSTKALVDLWQNDRSLDDHQARARETIIQTMTAVLMGYHSADEATARTEAESLWYARNKNRLDYSPQDTL